VRLIVFFLIFGLWPGAAEAAVDVGHAFLQGHTPHSEDCDPAAGEDHDEHQCSALFHLCGCHAPAPTTTELTVVLSPTTWSELSLPAVIPPSAVNKPAEGSAARTTRPPIA
jgi:hypothetical protein